MKAKEARAKRMEQIKEDIKLYIRDEDKGCEDLKNIVDLF